MPSTHISDNALELHLMGQIPDEVELARVEEHVIACVACQRRAEAMGDYITAMKDALQKANAESEGENGCPS